MPANLAALRLGTAVCFEDRWKGKVTALDITEHWEVLNLTVSSGTIFSQQSVKLPMSAVKSPLTETAVRIAANSAKAFAREIPPVAAPARPVSSETPVARQGLRFAGALLNTDIRYQVEEILLARGSTIYRVPLSLVEFEGPALRFTSEPDELTEFYFDADVLERVKRAITEDPTLMPDERIRIKPEVEAGVVTLRGNVWVRSARDHVVALVSSIPGVVAVRDEMADDIGLETTIGRTLLREGLVHAGVYARAKLGEITLYGTVMSQRQAEDMERAVQRIPGVTHVNNKLTVNPAAVAAPVRG